MISFTFCKTSIIQRHLLRFVITFCGCICFLLIYLYGTNTHVLLLGHATFCLCTIDCCVLQRKFVLLQNRLFFIRSTHAYIFCSHLFISHLSLVSYLFKMQDGEKIFQPVWINIINIQYLFKECVKTSWTYPKKVWRENYRSMLLFVAVFRSMYGTTNLCSHNRSMCM